MDPLSVTASIIAVLQLSAKVLTYLNDVNAASKDRAKCAVEASNLHSLLFSLRFRLEEGTADTPWYTAIRDLAVEKGPLDQFKQALETLQDGMTDGGLLEKACKTLTWKFKKEEIAGILNRIERLKSLIEIALQMDHFKLSQAIKDDTGFVRTHVPIIQSGVDKIRQDQDSASHRTLLEWISHSDYPTQQSDIIERRQEGTGQWFLDAPEVEKWLSEPKATLFCPGIPGAGKTMVAAIAIDHLLESVHKGSAGVAFVYCNYKAQGEQDVSSMLAAVLKQLVQARPSTKEPVERLHKQHASRGTKPSSEEIFCALRDVLAQYPTAYIVIDALDECRADDGTRFQFLTKLRDLQTTGDLRLMVTSRAILEIVKEFRDALTLEVQASKEDVKRFVAGQIYRLPNCIQRDLALQSKVQGKIVEAVDGMFLLARLHTDSLLDKRTPKEVKLCLDKLSKGSAALDDAYGDALERIKGQLPGDYERAKKVLSWITLAKRPLTTTEICCILAVEPGETELDPENILDIEDLVSVCAGLVVVDPESAVIRLVHYTTQEYFERTAHKWNPTAQQYIASTCLTYLSFTEFKSGSCATDKDFEERLQRSQFLDYAAKNWADHTRAVEGEVLELAGHEQIVKLLLENNANVNAQHGYNGNALQAASLAGHKQIVELLLNNNANVNAQGGLYTNALYAASSKGHTQIGGRSGNALQVASLSGHIQIVKLLLKNNADVNAQGGFHSNALQAASITGNTQMVKLLLDNNANINDYTGKFGHALQAALRHGSELWIKMVQDNIATAVIQLHQDMEELEHTCI
ncbi:hypothetical protein K504DRAFT_475959 [Pleomassaria siparia CBS 279.74]|uniref:Uncharacterized protein n=1 Tax=Pleomassaria siparia CBS 279.74 TaxID=1314801 RepID=A0A6G1KE32_9PLEO|nr:hypothetical protein K504DRAFT_475959 [Pleomassaria siparia CBS 279.74]